jgi:hypothetical protein
VRPFAHFLAGPAFAGVGALDAEGALPAGGGIDWWIVPRVGLRIGGDYRAVFAEDEHANRWRFEAGMVFALRSR